MSRVSAVNAAKTHCAHGHPFDDRNTNIIAGRRRCRACQARRDREQKKRKSGLVTKALEIDLDALVEKALRGGRYHVSESGEVALLKPRLGEPRTLRPRPTDNGYLRVNLYHQGRELTVSVHRLVAIWFLGATAVDGKQVAHLDHDKTNNRIGNLKPMTTADHYEYDRDRHRGSPPKSSWHPCADCGTTGGYTGGRPTPKRADGSKFGFSGQLCSTCWHRHYHHHRRANGYTKKRKAA